MNIQVSNFLSGIMYGDLITAVIVIFASVVLAKIAYHVINTTIQRLAKKTHTTLDDQVVKAVSRPVFIGFILAGFNTAIYIAVFLEPYLSILEKAFAALWILWGALLAMRLVDTALEWYLTEISEKTRTRFDNRFVPIIRKLVNGFIYAIAIILLLNRLGVEISPMLAGLGIGGLAVALALQETLSNFFSGAYLITEGAIKLGDYIELETGLRGQVQDISWRSCKIKTWADNLVIIPNSKLASSIVTNFHAPSKPLKFIVDCGVSYNSDLEKVEKVTLDVAKQVMKKWKITNFEPVMRYREFGDSNINFKVVLKAPSFGDSYEIMHDFIKALHARFKKEKIEISWPVRKLYMSK
ncbi:MAG: mechanosensitive ion channel family protein [archaeon]